MFLVIGSTTLDLIQSGVTTMPQPRGDEFTVDSLIFCAEPLQMRFGGNGANSAYVLAQLGAPVALGSAIGCDSAGELLTAPLQAIGVDLQGLLRHPTAATSVTTVISDLAHNRFAFHHAGASHRFALQDLPSTVVNAATALLISSYTLFLQWRPQGVATLLQQVKAQGGTTALDIGPAIGEPVTLAEIAPFLSDVDYLLANRHELAVCTDVAPTTDALVQGMAQLLGAGAGNVVIKQGADGALIQCSGDAAPTPVPGFPVSAQDTVGAGDSFNAGFLYAVNQGQDAVAAVRFANAVAALVVGSQRGVLGAPTVAAATALVAQA